MSEIFTLAQALQQPNLTELELKNHYLFCSTAVSVVTSNTFPECPQTIEAYLAKQNKEDPQESLKLITFIGTYISKEGKVVEIPAVYTQKLLGELIGLCGMGNNIRQSDKKPLFDCSEVAVARRYWIMDNGFYMTKEEIATLVVKRQD